MKQIPILSSVGQPRAFKAYPLSTQLHLTKYVTSGRTWRLPFPLKQHRS
jgi:hypothetical protein